MHGLFMVLLYSIILYEDLLIASVVSINVIVF